jgi:D-3-phosphoglycerate dehydrogenase
MDVGRINLGEKAVMVLNVDNSVSPEVLAQISQIEGIYSATLVKL